MAAVSEGIKDHQVMHLEAQSESRSEKSADAAPIEEDASTAALERRITCVAQSTTKT
jgi:hypothetical protein